MDNESANNDTAAWVEWAHAKQLRKGESPVPHSVRCKGCNAWMKWYETTAGARMCVDEHPHPDGNVVINDDGLAVVLKKGETPPEGVKRWMPHWATCPARQSFKKAKVAK
jgi:hypothetical protein